jgi:hypothetical protein
MPQFSEKSRFCAAMLIVIALSGAIAWFSAFTSITSYDDEGTVMAGARQFQEGRVLYDTVDSIYGPVYYIYQSIPYLITGAPISHNSIRVVTVVLRVLSGLIAFLLIYRITGSIALSLATHFVTFLALVFMGVETGHPQEICILAVLAVPLAACAGDRVALIWFGVLCAIMALAKINLGIFGAVSFAVVLSRALPSGPVRRLLSTTCALMALALPFALMKTHLGERWGQRFAILVFLSIAATLVSLRRVAIKPIRRLDLAAGLAAGTITAVVIASFVLARGSTISGMVQNLIIFPSTRFLQEWYIQLNLRRWMLEWGAANVVLAWLASTERLGKLPIVILKIALGVVVVYHVVDQDFTQLIGVATPMLWLVLAPGGRQIPGLDLLRPLMAVLSAVQVLYAFPVAGWQTAFVVVPFVGVAALCLWDTFPWWNSVVPPAVLRFAPAGTVTLVAALTLISANTAYQKFRSRAPLGLPGAEHLRLDSQLTGAWRRLNQEAQACSMLVSLPGLPTFNLISGKPIPTALAGSTQWMRMKTPNEQVIIVRELEAQAHPCAIYYPKALEIWAQSKKIASTPLMDYILHTLQTKVEIGGYQFRTKPQPPSAP